MRKMKINKVKKVRIKKNTAKFTLSNGIEAFLFIKDVALNKNMLDMLQLELRRLSKKNIPAKGAK
jgi:hypothetical protein